MTQLLFTAAANDPRNTHDFTNPQYAIDYDTLGTAATRNSFASGGASWKGLIFTLASPSTVASLTYFIDYCGGGGNPGFIQTSPDGSTWTTQPYTPTGVGSHINRADLDTPATGVLYIAFVWAQSSGYNCWIAVSYAYADGDASPTPPEPEPPPPVTVTIDGVQFDRLSQKVVRAELNQTGSFAFAINRYDEQATEEHLFRGALVQVTWPQIDPDVMWEGWLEEGDFDLISSKEEGGEELRFGGRGTLAYLERARMDAEQYEGARQECFPEKGLWIWENSAGSRTEGDIIVRMIGEAQAAARPSDPIPALTRTFTHEFDTDNVHWGDEELEGQWYTPIGNTVLEEGLRLVAAGLIKWEMTPGIVLNAWRSLGTDRSSTTFGVGKVRFVKGVNIRDELGKSMAGRWWATHAIIRKPNGDYTRTAIAGTFDYDQEAYFEASSDSTNTARREAQGRMQLRHDAQEALIFAVTSPYEGQEQDELTGLYLPGPAWTENGKYWLGDIVTLHTGTSDFDYDNVDQRIIAITLMEDSVGELSVIVELNAPYSSPGDEGDLKVTSGGGGGEGGSGGGGGGTGAHVHTSYQSLGEKNQPSGYAGLDADSLLDPAQVAAGTLTDGHVPTVQPDGSLAYEAPGGAGYTDPLTTRGDLVYRDASVTTRLPIGAAGRHLVSDGTDAAWVADYASIIVIIDGGGSAPSTGVKADVSVPFACEVVRARLLADTSGDAVVDVWRDSYASFPPTVADSITAAAKPTLSGAAKSSDITLTGWSKALAEGDTLRFNLDSIATITRLMVELRVRKT